MEKEKLISLIQKAQSGEQRAIEELLSHAHTSVSYQCRKMLPNAQDAEDLTQEILLTVYTKLDTLKEPAAFWGWLNRITATRCMNALSRTHVDLQLAEDEEGNSVLDSLETLDERQVPDKALDNAETARMIDEIVSGLPEAQRMSTLLYYYDELSVKEIAQIMSVSENAVKGRLNLARKAIKEKVLDYEKKGVKLYSVSVLPFLWYFLRSAAQSEADAAAAATCAANVMASGAANSAASATTAAGTTAARAVGFFSKKVIAGIIAGAVAVGGIGVAAVQFINNSGSSVPAIICQHQWSGATCTEPETCRKCGSTEGAALGHEWVDADCETPTTCTACGATEGQALGHTWTDATCETAKTCATCGEIEGEALGHEWVEATCYTAKTCSVCDQTEGEIPGHDMAEANYQQPATCKSCGYTEGDVLTPDFEKHGLTVIDAEMGKEYTYISTCTDDPTKKATGTLTMSNYSVFEGDETHEAVDGYEWHTVTFEIEYLYEDPDENAYLYGVYVQSLYANYYHIGGWAEGDGTGDNLFSVNYNGIDYPQCTITNDGHSFADWYYGVATYSCTFYWRVPVGYDGFILGYYDAGIDIQQGQYIYDVMDENTLYFRFGSGENAE